MNSTEYGSRPLAVRRHRGAPTSLRDAELHYAGDRVWVFELPAGALCHVTPEAAGLTPGGCTVPRASLRGLTVPELDEAVRLAPPGRALGVELAQPLALRVDAVTARLRADEHLDPLVPRPSELVQGVLDVPGRIAESLGRGGGQTPSADDALLGALLGLTVLGDPRRGAVAAATRARLAATSATSRHLLSWAIDGEFPEVLGDVARALCGRGELEPNLDRLLAWGATSGWYVGVGLATTVLSVTDRTRSAA